MLTVVSYANISNDVYSPPKFIQPIKGHKPLKIGYSGLARMLDADPTMNINNPFYAQLYINFRNGEAIDAVAAYRGTSKVGSHWYTGYTDYEVDVKSWYKSVIFGNQSLDSLPGDHFPDHTARFYLTCRDYLGRYFPYLRLNRLHVTGHSLGGALAALMPARCGFPTTAVTFNAPGIGTIPGVHADRGGRIFGVEARYDFVSKIGVHIEKQIYLVDVPEMESVAKQAFVLNDEASKLEQEIRTDPESFKTPFRVELAKVDETTATDATLLSGLAQHRMENLFNALKEPTYSALANKLIV